MQENKDISWLIIPLIVLLLMIVSSPYWAKQTLIKEIYQPMEKNIVISLEKAKEIYPNADQAVKTLLEETFGKELLMKVYRWEDLENIDGYYIFGNSQISKKFNYDTKHPNRNVFKYKKQANSAVAMAQLSQLLFEFNKGWQPNWNNYKTEYYVLRCYRETRISVDSSYSYKEFLVFPSYEKAEEFQVLHEELIKEYFEGF